MPRPLYDRITAINANAKARFCMPAHSGEKAVDGIYFCADYDWTEIDGLDNLLCSNEVILQSENIIAQSYGYRRALMLTGGSTSAMQIAMLFAKERGGSVVSIGDMHKSFYSLARIFDVDIYGFSNLKEAQDCDYLCDISFVFVTSPNYFGFVAPLKEIKKFAEERGALLVVDEAHSAHFPYSDLLPNNASEYADLAFASMHKTLPVYGGGAVLFASDESTYEICRRLRAEVHTTSPSYLVMASMDYAQDLMAKEGKKFYADVKLAVDKFKKQNSVGRVVENDDFSRLVLKIEGMDCDKASQELAKRGIFAEMAYGDMLVFIVTPFNYQKLGLLKESLEGIPLEKLREYPNFDLHLQRTQRRGRIVFVDVDEALGETSALDVGLYPPGIASIKKGDILDADAINFIKKYSTKLFGLASGKVGVLK